MPKTTTIADLYPIIEEKLRAGGFITLKASGFSMQPMLKHQRDSVTIGPVNEPLSVNDVVLYRREGGQFVLHRIIGQESNGNYILCGDNQFVPEHSILHQQIVGRVQAFNHKGYCISCTSFIYKAYVCTLPVIRLIRRGLSISRRYMNIVKQQMHQKVNGNR